MVRPQLLAALCGWTDGIGAMTGMVGSLAAIAGILIARRGLSTWREQLQGQTDHALARRLAIGAYKARDELRLLRSPYVTPFETAAALKERAVAISAVPVSDRARIETLAVYTRRHDRFISVIREVDADLLEAEAIWGNEPMQLYARIQGIHRNVLAAVRMHIEGRDSTTGGDRRRFVELLYAGPADPDGVEAEYAAMLEPFAQFLRSHLGRAGVRARKA